MTSEESEKYPEEIDRNAPENSHLSIVHMIEDACGRHRDDVAIECLGSSYTYGDLDRHSANFASYLQQLGLERGDRVALMMPNIGQFPVVSFGTHRAGFVSVNVNPLYTSRELGHQLRDSGAKAIVILENFASTLEKVIAETEVEHVIVARMGDMIPGLKRHIVNLVVKYLKKMVPAYDLPHAVGFREALAKGATRPMERVEVAPDDVAFIQYTGGTTGVAKGATLLHRNVVANVCQVSGFNDNSLPVAGARVLQPLPLYHIFALNLSILCFNKGYRQLLIPNPRDIKGFVKELKGRPFAMMPGVNTLYAALAHNEDFVKLDFSDLKLCFSGGTATYKDTSDRWEEITGQPIIEGYGLSETSPIISANRVALKEFTGTVGYPLPGTRISLRNGEGEEVPHGSPGEICVKGPQVFPGYWQRPDATVEAFTPDGFFMTGDIAIFDDEGRLKIVDRKKDMIIVSGFNVYPTEIEGVVAEIEGVLECACIGVPSEKTGESPKLYIIKKDPDLTKEEIFAYCKANLTAYKRPRHIQFVEELPKSPVGKVLRKELRKLEEAAR
ncbi:AMP-binding protein [Rhodobacteraceae bacterium NNCM2]|nr:AMP-binding protein [Coraliihabitans acroporae]